MLKTIDTEVMREREREGGGEREREREREREEERVLNVIIFGLVLGFLKWV